MDRLEFECICELADTINNYIGASILKREHQIITVYGKYNVVKDLLETLIRFGYPIYGIVELEDYEASYYNKEFVLYITEDYVSCEKVYKENNYCNSGGDISFVHEDCNSKLLKHIDSKIIYEFSVGECDDNIYEEDYECDCDECCECCDECCDDVEDDDNHEVAATSNYFVNGEQVSKSVFDKYDKEIRSRIKEFEDEMDAWRRMLFS